MTRHKLKQHDFLMELLSDENCAIDYVNRVIEEADRLNDPRVILLALKRVANAKNLSMVKLAEAADVNRQGVYKALSEQGNPEFKTLVALLRALGFTLSIKKSKRVG